MQQLIYRSVPVLLDRGELDAMLEKARISNEHDGITGALVCRQGLYLQLIEGPSPAIAALYARISVDPRHSAVKLISNRQVERRLFSEWSMLDERAHSPEVLPPDMDVSFLTAAPTEELLAVLKLIASAARDTLTNVATK